MSLSQSAFALYLSGYSFHEIDSELDLHRGRAQLSVMHIQLVLEEFSI